MMMEDDAANSEIWLDTVGVYMAHPGAKTPGRLNKFPNKSAVLQAPLSSPSRGRRQEIVMSSRQTQG